MGLNLTEAKRVDDWYAARKKGIGGSDAAVCLGISPWKTPVRLWREKRGEIPEDDITNKQFVYWGLRLENTIAEEYTARTGHECREVGRILKNKEYPWMLCNLDRVVLGTPSKTILEIKTVGQFVYMNTEWGDDGTDQVPAYYYAQAQHNMIVCGAEFCDMPVLIGGNEYRCYTIPINKDFAEVLIKRESIFWHCVQTGNPPPAMRLEDLSLLWPFNAPGEIVEADEQTAENCESLRRVKNLIKSCKAESERLEMAIKERMKDAEYLTFNGETLATWRTTKKGGRMFRIKDIGE